MHKICHEKTLIRALITKHNVFILSLIRIWVSFLLFLKFFVMCISSFHFFFLVCAILLMHKPVEFLASLITVVCSLAAGALLLCALLAAGVAVLVVLEAPLAVEGAVNVLSCRLTLAVVLAVTKVCDKHFEELALGEGEFLDTLSEEVLLVHGVAVLLPPHQLPLDPAIYEGRLGGRVRPLVFLILLLNIFDNVVQHVIFQAWYTG